MAFGLTSSEHYTWLTYQCIKPSCSLTCPGHQFRENSILKVHVAGSKRRFGYIFEVNIENSGQDQEPSFVDEMMVKYGSASRTLHGWMVVELLEFKL